MSVGQCAVLVVGAGPAGLVLACALRLHGLSVRVIDQASGPAVTSRANILHARGVEVLDRIGALGDLPDRAETALTITQYLDGEPAITIRFGDLGLGAARPALYISQAEIEARLRSRLRELGTDVAWNTALSRFIRNGEQIIATTADGGTIAAGWLVGCDGAHSTVRKLAGIGFPGASITEKFLLADVHADWPIGRAGGHGWPSENGPFFAMPMPDEAGTGNLWRLMAYDPQSSGDMDEHEIIERFEQLVPERTGRTDMHIGDAVWTSTFRAHRRLANTYHQDRIFLAGDAAHIHSPLGGQGMVTGMGDAENLAWKLALVIKGKAHEPLLDTYEAERRPLATEVLRSTTSATRMQIGKGLLMRLLRNRILVPLANLPATQRRMSQIASQLWVTYRKGPLAGGIGAYLGPSPRPGDRVPDLECERMDGTVTRLHAELGGRWALLAPAGTDGRFIAEAVRHLEDEIAVLETSAREDVWLVRPDAHLAWRGRKPAPLGRWLDDAFRDPGAQP